MYHISYTIDHLANTMYHSIWNLGPFLHTSYIMGKIQYIINHLPDIMYTYRVLLLLYNIMYHTYTYTYTYTYIYIYTYICMYTYMYAYIYIYTYYVCIYIHIMYVYIYVYIYIYVYTHTILS